ncbi:MAG: GIY-YIG nuclease family protein [Candidatus Aenigmatarchaeota archaeon]
MKGIYILLINVKTSFRTNVGSLGKIIFEKGLYAYVGSAQNNIEKRVERHLSKNKKTFWHIDYLLKSDKTKVIKILYKNSGSEEECRTAALLSRTELPVMGFGCSDCHCKSHLFRLRNFKSLETLGMKEMIAGVD